MQSLNKTARLAGFLYLLVIITGPFVLIYVPGKLFVPGDATATVANILAHESLFRAHIVVGLFSELLFVFTVLALYRLLKEVDRVLAAVMAILMLIIAPISFLGVANEFATLTFLRGGNFLTAFDKPQRDALATLLISFDSEGVFVYEMSWGLWLFPLALLVYRSKFLPRFLGVWLFVNGIAYVVMSTVGLLFSQHIKGLSTIATPFLLGEVALSLWLLIAGVRVRPSSVSPAPAT